MVTVYPAEYQVGFMDREDGYGRANDLPEGGSRLLDFGRYFWSDSGLCKKKRIGGVGSVARAEDVPSRTIL